ncbi:unnamed protein product [Effrenium voratum]|nr:unnamed protein product [Effrenium voratum]
MLTLLRMPATGTGPATVPALVNISFTEASRPSLCRSVQMLDNSKMCGGKRATSSMLFEMVLNCKLWNAMSSQTPLLCKVFCSTVGAGCGGRQQVWPSALGLASFHTHRCGFLLGKMRARACARPVVQNPATEQRAERNMG